MLLSSGTGVEAAVDRGGAGVDWCGVSVERGGASAESLLLLTRRGVSRRR